MTQRKFITDNMESPVKTFKKVEVDPEGWYGEGGGFKMGNTCIPVVDSF